MLAPFASYFGPKWGFSYHEEKVGLAGVGRAGDLNDVVRQERRREDDWRARGEVAGDEDRRRLMSHS